jgi:thiamine-phosphate kinase
MLVAGTHFFADTDPEDLGWKTLAVNVSDLAAMGATPRWAFLALALPAADEAWIAAFARGFFACADAHGVDLAGGDTTRGPLTLSVTIIGEVPQGQAITRAGGRPGDDLWVSGQPGMAALGLAALRGETQLSTAGRAACIAALQRPQPRIALGLALRGVATAMLDVSDGLLGDLGHILECSATGAIIDVGALPLAALRETAPTRRSRDAACSAAVTTTNCSLRPLPHDAPTWKPSPASSGLRCTASANSAPSPARSGCVKQMAGWSPARARATITSVEQTQPAIRPSSRPETRPCAPPPA